MKIKNSIILLQNTFQMYSGPHKFFTLPTSYLGSVVSYLNEMNWRAKPHHRRLTKLVCISTNNETNMKIIEKNFHQCRIRKKTKIGILPQTYRSLV